MFAFTAPLGFHTLRLAAVLDSLVRVSRRVGSRHFASVLNPGGEPSPPPVAKSNTAAATPAQLVQNAPPKRLNHTKSSLTQSASPVTVSGAFHPLFKVLSIFPSRYLFAIGLPLVFSL